MSLMFQPLRKYATFSGRARRTEYWLWQLFVVILYTLLAAWLLIALGPSAWERIASGQMDEASFPMGAVLPILVMGILWLVLLLPSLAVTVRRLHDSGNSGWWVLITLTAFGGIVILIFALIDGTIGPNRHGPDPRGRTAPDYR